MQPADHHHGGIAADGGQLAVVAILEARRRLAGDPAPHVAAGVPSHLLRCRRDARHALHRGEIADDEDLRMPGHRQVGLDLHAARTVERRAELGAKRRAPHAGRPDHGLRGDALLAELYALGVDPGHHAPRPHGDAEMFERELRLRREIRRVGRQHAVRALDEHDARVVRVDAAELAAQRVAGDLGEGAGELHAGGAAADHHEREPGAALHRIGLALGALECGEHAPADLERVFQGLQSRRVRRPLVVPEIAVGGAGGKDQVVVGELIAVFQAHHAPRDVDCARFAIEHCGVALMREDVPNRPGDGGRREPGGRHLVEERGKEVVIRSIDHGHLDRRSPESLRRPQSAEAAADDNDARGRHGRR